jgi:hypothetical protein
MDAGFVSSNKDGYPGGVAVRQRVLLITICLANGIHCGTYIAVQLASYALALAPILIMANIPVRCCGFLVRSIQANITSGPAVSQTRTYQILTMNVL